MQDKVGGLGTGNRVCVCSHGGAGEGESPGGLAGSLHPAQLRVSS